LAQTSPAADQHAENVADMVSDEQVRRLITADGRRIAVPGVLNLRDLGGYPAAGGARLRWRTLLRSDALHKLDAADLAGLGLRTIVDLRTELEAEYAPSPLAGLPARLYHVSLIGPDLPAEPLELEAIYQFIITERGAAIAAAIRALCADGAFPALVHCSAGKDRTGIVVALILAVLGVPDEVIAADYAYSSVCLDPERTPAIGQLRASTGLDEDRTRELLSCPPDLIVDVLALIRAASGTVEGYLTEHGLRAADLAALRAGLLAR
jgi:protein-tyrosine phosphatase